MKKKIPHLRHSISLLSGVIIFALLLFYGLFQQKPAIQTAEAASPIQHVFLIMMENHNWSSIKGSSQAPYINNTLLPIGAHAEQYFNPPGNHPSEPNYLWLEAGTSFGITNDNNPSANHQSTTNHLVTLLTKAGLSWKAYEEDIPGTVCPLTNVGNYAVRHEPFTYFDDVTNNLNPNSQNCIQHLRPFPQLATDLTNNSIANYNFITPNLIDDMHNGTIQQGDTWLSQNVPLIMNSQAYKNNGVIIITWDEGESHSDGPIGMIILSPLVKKNYSNTIHYDHSSTLKTVEEIFGVSPFLGAASNATDLSDFFTTSITSGGGSSGGGGTGGTNPTPTDITPTFHCLGPCLTNSPSPTVFTLSPTPIPTGTVSTAPAPNPCVTTASTGIVHAYKTHTHAKGAISQFFLLLVEFLLKLLEKLLGVTITLPQPEPKPTLAPTIPEPGITITVAPISLTPAPVTETPVPTMNPCVTPTNAPSTAPSHAVSAKPMPTISVTSATPTTIPSTTGMQVKGNQLLKDGKNFLAHGFNMVGVLSPPGCTNGTGVTARNHFGQAEMTAAKAWNANIFRFQVSQPGLATTNASNLSTYLTQIINSVTLAEANGFVVILSMQDQAIGCGPAQKLPTAETVTAWKNLAPKFASDPHVMFELFNEPQNNEDSVSWNQWLNGGSSPLGITAVGHQTLLNTIRSLNANNVVIADGGSYAEQLQGIPMLKDTNSGHGVVYAVHPYYFTEPNPQSAWDTRFGYLTSSVPVIATEWNYKLTECSGQQPTLAPTFLSYLQSHHIGITAHSFDVQGLLIQDWTWTPTTCPGSSTGPGAVTKYFFSTLP